MHVKNIQRSDAVQLINHDLRKHENYSNEDINPEYTKENYDLSPDRGMEKAEYMKERLDQLTVCNQKKTTVLQSVIVTMPRGIPFEDTDKVLKAAYDFFCDFYGIENIVSADVHKDEYRRSADGVTPDGEDSGMPHIHIKAIPESEGRVSARGKTPKKVLTNLHKDLTKYVSEQVGYEVPLLNGATDGGNKAIAELKAERAVKEAEEAEKEAKQRVVELEAEKAGLEQHVSELNAQVKDMTKEITELKKNGDPKISKVFEERKTFFSGKTYYKVSPENVKKFRKAIKENNAEVNRLKGQAVRAEEVGDLGERVVLLENTVKVLEESNKTLTEQNADLTADYKAVTAECAYWRLPYVRAEVEEISTGCFEVLSDIQNIAVTDGVDVNQEMERGTEAAQGLYDLTRAETPDTIKNAEKRLYEYADSCETEINRFRSVLNRICESAPMETANKMSKVCKSKAESLISAVRDLFGLKEDGIEVMPERVADRQRSRKKSKDNNIGL